LLAVTVNEYVPAVPPAGAPEIVAVPLECAVNERPFGNVPIFVTLTVGNPLVVIVNVGPLTPTVKDALFALVIAGG
jgi:hypothetical protein